MVRKIIKKTKEILLTRPKLLYDIDKKVVNKPFYFKGISNRAVLLLHGWTATPYELRRLGLFLNSAGYTVYAPLLPGHGTKPSDLEKIDYSDWVDASQNALTELTKKYDKVFVGGTSMGATLTIELAKEHNEIAGIVLMATPYRLRFEKIMELTTRIMGIFKKYHKKVYPPTFGAATTVTRKISYQEYPVKNVMELAKLIKKSRKNLDKINQPCLIMQSSSDHIVTKSSLMKIYNQISSVKKEKKYIKKVYHTFISDIRNEHVFKDILIFLDKI